RERRLRPGLSKPGWISTREPGAQALPLHRARTFSPYSLCSTALKISVLFPSKLRVFHDEAWNLFAYTPGDGLSGSRKPLQHRRGKPGNRGFVTKARRVTLRRTEQKGVEHHGYITSPREPVGGTGTRLRRYHRGVLPPRLRGGFRWSGSRSRDRT